MSTSEKSTLTDEERKQRKKESQARWLTKNPDYYKGYRRAWRKANRDRETKTHREWVEKNRAHVNEYQRNYKREKRMQECIAKLEKENIV